MKTSVRAVYVPDIRQLNENQRKPTLTRAVTHAGSGFVPCDLDLLTPK